MTISPPSGCINVPPLSGTPTHIRSRTITRSVPACIASVGGQRPAPASRRTCSGCEKKRTISRPVRVRRRGKLGSQAFVAAPLHLLLGALGASPTPHGRDRGLQPAPASRRRIGAGEIRVQSGEHALATGLRG